MKDQVSIIVAISMIALAAASIYKKYRKRNKERPGSTPQKKETGFSIRPGDDDDYEPYSGK